MNEYNEKGFAASQRIITSYRLLDTLQYRKGLKLELEEQEWFAAARRCSLARDSLFRRCLKRLREGQVRVGIY